MFLSNIYFILVSKILQIWNSIFNDQKKKNG